VAFYVLLALVGFCCVRGLARWRDGLFAIVVIAALQDPLRKLVPSAPGYLVLASAPVLGAVVWTLMNGTRSWWSAFDRSFPRIGRAAGLFVLACVPAAFISAFYGPGSWILTLLGAFSYSVLFVGVLVGFHYPRSTRDLRQFIGFYCILTSVMLSGATIEYVGLWPDSPVLGTAALD
jgi:hypothetical protein